MLVLHTFNLLGDGSCEKRNKWVSSGNNSSKGVGPNDVSSNTEMMELKPDIVFEDKPAQHTTKREEIHRVAVGT